MRTVVVEIEPEARPIVFPIMARSHQGFIVLFTDYDKGFVINVLPYCSCPYKIGYSTNWQ